MCLCVCVYIHAYTDIHTYIHKYIHTYLVRSRNLLSILLATGTLQTNNNQETLQSRNTAQKWNRNDPKNHPPFCPRRFSSWSKPRIDPFQNRKEGRYVCVYACMHACMHVYIYIHTCIYGCVCVCVLKNATGNGTDHSPSAVSPAQNPFFDRACGRRPPAGSLPSSIGCREVREPGRFRETFRPQ